MSEKAKILFQCSTDFQEALYNYARKNNTSSSEVIREAVSELIGYDLAADKAILGRPRVYSTAEDRLEAQAKARREKRELGRRILEAVEREMKLDDINSLETWLNNHAP